MRIHSMRIADSFTSNMYIAKLNWLPAKLNAESYFLSRTGVLHQGVMGQGPGSWQEGIVPRRAAQQPSKTIKDYTQLQQEYSSRAVLYQTLVPTSLSDTEAGRGRGWERSSRPKRQPGGDTMGCLGTGGSAQTWIWKRKMRGCRVRLAERCWKWAHIQKGRTISPWWILLHRKSPFQIDDVALVFKHPITEGDLQDR